MSKRDEFISFIDEIKSIFPTISDGQRKELLRRAVQQYNVSVDEAVDILDESGISIGEQVDYFEVLGLSITEFVNCSESEIVLVIESAHEKLYSESLKAGGRPRADGRTEGQWRTLLNEARDVLIDVDKRIAYIDRLESSVLPTKRIALKEELAHEEVDTNTTRNDVSSVPIEKNGMVCIPAGEFQMGSNEYDSPEKEKPAHAVYIDEFYMDKYPVTNEQFREFVEANPLWNNLGMYNFQFVIRKYRDSDYLKNWHKGKYPKGKEDHPVNWVSWHAAMAYSQWVGKRLPTEAEWEKAACGGLVGNKFPWGNAIYTEYGNFEKRVGETTTVGKYPANGYGVYDIVGNVSEWCLDEWNSKFYKSSEVNNPVSGGSIERIIDAYLTSKKKRVIRGGSWKSEGHDVRVSYRDYLAPWKTNSFVGFRCVMSSES